MANILIAYGTTEGHTRKIAHRVADWLMDEGHTVQLYDTTRDHSSPAFEHIDRAILAGSLHQSRHQASLTHFVQSNRLALQAIPTALLSVSLTAALHDADSESEARACINRFIQEVRWKPTVTLAVAGALKYTEYDWLKRMVMKAISKQKGGDIDTSKDYEYTDWEALKRFILEFVNGGNDQPKTSGSSPP